MLSPSENLASWQRDSSLGGKDCFQHPVNNPFCLSVNNTSNISLFCFCVILWIYFFSRKMQREAISPYWIWVNNLQLIIYSGNQVFFCLQKISTLGLLTQMCVIILIFLCWFSLFFSPYPFSWSRDNLSLGPFSTALCSPAASPWTGDRVGLPCRHLKCCFYKHPGQCSLIVRGLQEVPLRGNMK